MTDLAAQLRHALVARLVTRGALRDPRWIAAFEKVPRHVFVPCFYLDRAHDGHYEFVDGTDPANRHEWLDRVYTDDALATEVADGTAISSSSQPSLMAMMLEALGCSGDEHVLEVGTGTGYNAALLCEGLGSGQVTSIDIDADLVATASARLAALGYATVLAVADGADGHQPRAPYDRLIATCSVPAVPPAWITQVSRGGLILVNLYTDLGGGALCLLRVSEDGAEGRFLPFAGHFMPTRTFRRSMAVDLLDAHLDDATNATAHPGDGPDGAGRPTSVRGDVLDDGAFAMFAALRVPAQRISLLPEGQPEQVWLLGGDGSWACQTASAGGEPVAAQGGHMKLWNMLEAARSEWIALGRPGRADFGLTVTTAGDHVLWHRSPDGRCWALAPRAGAGR